jgi:hypothetical protein
MIEYVYFFNKHPNIDFCSHWIVALAEGFSELGIPCFGNRNMGLLPNNGGYLVNYDENHPYSEADIVFFNADGFENDREMFNAFKPMIQTTKQGSISVFVDNRDGVRTPGFSKGAQLCDIVLKCHFNKKYHYPRNFYPWQFGVTNRILNATQPLPFEEKEKQLLLNFRQKHQLRDSLNKMILPVFEQYMEIDRTVENFSPDDLSGSDLLYYKQTNARHYPQYYQRLGNSMFCAAYGGVFAISWGNYNKYTARIAREINNIIPIFEYDRVRQWDSWRLWEAWTAACCVVHVDLEKYGCMLPVMPENGKHYIGIEALGSLDKLEKLLKDEQRIREISEEGRNFVLENYLPKNIVQRLIDLIDFNLK